MKPISTDKQFVDKTIPVPDTFASIPVKMEKDATTDSSPFGAWEEDREFRPPQSSIGRTNVFDVAAYILGKCGELSALKLQKLVYYCQAWSLVWDDEPLFPERIEAWAYGPVVKELYEFHRGHFSLSSIPIGSPFKLSATQKETIDAVIKYYGEKTPQQLIELTHLEDPWKNARDGVPVGAPCSREITLQAMQEYYASLL